MSNKDKSQAYVRHYEVEVNNTMEIMDKIMKLQKELGYAVERLTDKYKYLRTKSTN